MLTLETALMRCKRAVCDSASREECAVERVVGRVAAEHKLRRRRHVVLPRPGCHEPAPYATPACGGSVLPRGLAGALELERASALTARLSMPRPPLLLLLRAFRR